MIIAVCGSSLTVFMWFMVWGGFFLNILKQSLKVIVGCFRCTTNANTFSAHQVVKKQMKINCGINRKHKCNRPEILCI